MASRRYSRILQSARYYSAIDNYIKYITDASKKGARIGSGTARPASRILYVNPFGLDLGSGSLAKVSGALSTWNTRKTALTGFTLEDLPADTVGLKLDGFRSARVVIVTGLSANGSVKTSAVTGMKYKSYGGSSSSLPFGKKPGYLDQTSAFNEIKADIGDLGASARISFTPESV
jgi:hypothetical protein